MGGIPTAHQLPQPESPRKQADPLVDRKLGGRYRIVSPLAQGGMASVYFATDPNVSDSQVAVKILRPEQAAAQEHRSRFLQEMKILADVRHPGVVPIHDFGEEEDGLMYIVMDYVRGRTLLAYLRDEGTVPTDVPGWPNRPIKEGLPLLAAVALIRKIAETVAFLHRNGVLHRDLKPDNVMIVDSGGQVSPVLLDLGLAKIALERPPPPVDDRTQLDVRPTVMGQLMGTIAYMPPEQLKGDVIAASDRWVDVYALVCIFYELLCGFAPHEDHPNAQAAGDPNAFYRVLYALRCASGLPFTGVPSEVRPDLPDWVDRFFEKGLASGRDNRFQSVEEFLQSLDDCLRIGGAKRGAADSLSAWHLGAAGLALILLSLTILAVRHARSGDRPVREAGAAVAVAAPDRPVPSSLPLPAIPIAVPGDAPVPDVPVAPPPVADASPQITEVDAGAAPVLTVPSRRHRRRSHPAPCGGIDPVTGTLVPCFGRSPR